MTASVHEKLIERLRKLADYWRAEGQYIEVAITVGDEITAEYSASANSTAALLDLAAVDLTTLQNRVGVLTSELERLYTLEGVEWGDDRSQAVSNAINRVAALGGEA